MKKTMIILSALLALVACNKEIPQNEGVIDASKVVFHINVETADDAATKGVKTGWGSGDVVYVFFQDNTTQYVKMTFNGSSWSYSDKDGGTSYTGLSLAASGKKLSAVYMPSFVRGTATPSYKSSKWTIGTSLGGFILTAINVDYSIASKVGDIVSLTATLNMTAPDNLVQVYINASNPASGNEYVLNMTNVRPFTFDGIFPGGTATITKGTTNFPMHGYKGTMGSETGYYFWGILNSTSLGSIKYDFQLVEQNASKGYAISSKSKTVSSKKLTGPIAIKLSSLTDKGNFVSMGYSGGPLWATGNLNQSGKKIVDPLQAGDFVKYGRFNNYSSTTDYTGMESPLSTGSDAAYKTNTSWRIPTKVQLEALGSNTTHSWKTGWTALGTTKGGYLLTSKSNGISLFFAAAGGTDTYGTVYAAGNQLNYWSSTPKDASSSYGIYALKSESLYFSITSMRHDGKNIRPVMN